MHAPEFLDRLSRTEWPLVGRLGRSEWPILAGLVAALGALWVFIEVAEEVLEGETGGFDRALLLAFRNPADQADPLGPPWVEEMMRDFSGLGSTAVLTLLTASAVGYLLLAGKSRAALAVFFCVGAGQLLSSGLKLLFERARPDLVPHVSTVYTFSFPSGHSTMSAVVFLTLAALLARVEGSRRLSAYLLFLGALLAFLVGLSRVYLGVHWPTDVIGGWAIGAAWALLCWVAVLWLQRRGRVEAEPPSA
jgi:undecaprenyl-diphosphatase